MFVVSDSFYIKFELIHDLVGKSSVRRTGMAQGVWVRTPSMTVLGHDMVGDVKKCSEFILVGDTSAVDINSKGLSKLFFFFIRFYCSSAKFLLQENGGLFNCILPGSNIVWKR